jgi:WhiB family redox-sensing transcriptional regulator
VWQDRAACRGDDERGRRLGRLFFPPKFERSDARVAREARAKRICASCPVIERCRTFGRDEAYGVWGGTTPAEREYPDWRRSG